MFLPEARGRQNCSASGNKIETTWSGRRLLIRRLILEDAKIAVLPSHLLCIRRLGKMENENEGPERFDFTVLREESLD
jgi:hypothetical protein